MSNEPKIDLICNIVGVNARGEVLLVRYDDSERWWLPGRSLVPYEHPDEVAPAVAAIEGLKTTSVAFGEIESFRGRTGWHVMFNYVARLNGEPADKENARWFPASDLPQTAHGGWERGVIERALAKA